jgi:hypothetical protein
MTKEAKEYNREYYARADVKARHSEYMKNYYKRNKLKLLKKQADYYSNNKDKIREYMKIYMREYKKKKSTQESSDQ